MMSFSRKRKASRARALCDCRCRGEMSSAELPMTCQHKKRKKRQAMSSWADESEDPPASPRGGGGFGGGGPPRERPRLQVRWIITLQLTSVYKLLPAPEKFWYLSGEQADR